MDKRIFLLVFFWVSWLGLQSQSKTISLEECLEAVSNNHPSFQKSGVIQQLGTAQVEKANQNWWPKLKISGQLTWQNKVTQLNIDAPIPGFEVPQIPKTQYRVAGELNQILFDGGMTSRQKTVNKASTAATIQQNLMQQQDIKDNIQNLYFNGLLIDQKLNSLHLVEDDLTSQLQRLKNMKENGLVTGASVDRLDAELLQLQLTIQQTEKARLSLLENLSTLTGLAFDAEVSLQLPKENPQTEARAELALFDAQKQILDGQLSLINAKGVPQLQAFALGGYGQPGFNFLDENPAFMFQAGLRLGWDISSFYTNKKDREILSLQQLQIDKDKEAYNSFNQTQKVNLNKELQDYQDALQTDEAIITLREKIKMRAGTQLENGTLTTAEYISDVNAWSKAMLDRDIHQVQVLQTVYQLRFYP
ncbi:MAG: TolC family protein [Saprospiraceae bacterium]|nr:TolC family protein [Saprospiraceae bacterium]